MLSLKLLSLATLALARRSSAANVKRGLAFADSSNSGDISVAENTQVYWVYDWGTTVPDVLANSGLRYIPMQWGIDGVESFAAMVEVQGSMAVLGFNEPDLDSQSNIDPVIAASLWIEYIQPLKANGVRVGAPAVSSSSSGMPWLAQFLESCTGCTFDFVPLHWYGDGCTAFSDYITSFHEQFPSWPLWVTEFASTNADVSGEWHDVAASTWYPDLFPAVVEEFCAQSIALLDSLEWIEGYAWFAFYRQTPGSFYNLLDANGQPNVLGQIYLQ
ncbi:hypothetical protein F5I97DRAFT_608395 [Phlebopus sp. FC_14]|nr:hypothetical protein F5I97DRAFT_608395 [Phlebopus sp. FC_14]